MVLVTKAMVDMLASLFNWRASISTNQPIHEIIGDKHDLEKACRYAEVAISVAERNATFVDERTRSRFERFAKRFRRYK